LVASLVRALEDAVSRTRLEAYRPAGAADLDMVVNYLWNTELSEALYPSLQAFEIALRNGIHRALTVQFGTELWFDRGILLEWQEKTLEEARRELTLHRKPHEPGRIVAELSFGFWSSMFNSPYEEPLWYANGAASLDIVFPHIPRAMRTRRTISRRIERIRRLRNRVFHYEPIWNKADLHQRHQQILEALAWISPETREMVGQLDRFEHILSGRDVVVNKVLAWTEDT
jgi:hypothetical protein